MVADRDSEEGSRRCLDKLREIRGASLTTADIKWMCIFFWWY